MKDYFSTQASEYAQFRPEYPEEVIDWMLQFVQNRGLALDVATGSGQLAHKLSRSFELVYATDMSERQIMNAKSVTNVIYQVEPAEKTGFSDKKFDLVSVAQAIHWFDFDKFYAEVYRILKPDGIFAVLGYGLFSTNFDSDKILNDYYCDIVGPYWGFERKYIDQRYRTIPFPFDEIPAPDFTNRLTWSFEQLIGYLETWSATVHFKEAKGFDPVDTIRERLKSSWENSNKQVVFPLLLRLGRLKLEKLKNKSL